MGPSTPNIYSTGISLFYDAVNSGADVLGRIVFINGDNDGNRIIHRD